MPTPYRLPTPAHLASELRRLRRARGLTQAELGAQLGVRQARIGKIERDPGCVSLAQLVKILAALGAELAIRPAPSGAHAATTSPE
jgi:HTH-type transcriptional regulator/antitoxin HipB